MPKIRKKRIYEAYKQPKEYEYRANNQPRKGKWKWKESLKGPRKLVYGYTRKKEKEISQNISRFYKDFNLIYDLWKKVHPKFDLNDFLEATL